MKRIDALDGWRGIAILLVLIQHFQNLVFLMEPAPYPTGQHGVTAFFVLSGFLITGKLIEKDSSLGRFYVRRFFRLMPVAWTYLLIRWGFGLPYDGHLIPPDVTTSVLLVRNYFGKFAGEAATVHFWSLSIEEQFYLVWPALLLWLGASRAKWAAAIGAIASYLCGVLFVSFYSRPYFGFHTEVHADALLVGCFLAIALQGADAKSLFIRYARWAFWPAVIYLGWVAIQPNLIPSLLECGAWGIAIAYTRFHAPKVLTFAPLTWIGRISYSVYVWNMILLAEWRSASHESWIQIGCLLLPLASYYLIEKPCISLGRRVSGLSCSRLSFRVVEVTDSSSEAMASDGRSNF